jgi:RecB family exonuclease
VSVLTIYPTALKVEEVLKARSRAGEVSLGHRLTTFPELIDGLDAELPDVPPVLADALAVVLFREALAEDLAGTGGAHVPARDAGRLIGELKAACLGATELAAVAQRVRAPGARGRLELICRIAWSYESLLARLGRADRHDRERRVLALLGRAEETGARPRALAGVSKLVIAEIYDYSLLQFFITRALIRIVGDAELITLAHPENVDATRFVERTWNRFVEDPTIADRVLPDFVVRGGRTGTLARVLATLFIEPKPAMPAAAVEPKPVGAVPEADGSVAVVAAPTRYAEVEEAGRRIRDLLAGGLAPDRIAILVRDPTTYRDLVADVCRRYRIPVAFRHGRPLAEHGVVQQIVSVLRAVLEGLPRDGLVECLRSTYFRTAASGAVALLDVIGYVDEATAPIEACMAQSEERLGLLAAGQQPARARASAAHSLERLRREGPALAEVVRCLRTLDAPRTVAGHVAALAATLTTLGFTVTPEDSGELIGRTGAGTAQAWRDGAAFTAVNDLLEELAALGRALDGDRPIALASFLGRVLTGIDALEVEEASARADSGRARALFAARGLDFDAVFVLGLDEGSFPAPRRQDPLLDDALRAEVNRHAGAVLRAALGPAAQGASLRLVLRGSAERAAEDPFLFYLALSTAERQVVLTYPTRDEKGDPLVRSPYIDEILTIVPGAESEAGARPLVPSAGDCRERAELLNRAVLDAMAGEPGLLAALSACAPAGSVRHVVTRIAIEWRRVQYALLEGERDAASKERLADAFVGRLAPLPALRRLLGAMEWSASRLEEMGVCGFRFFAHRVLGLEPNEPADVDLNALEEGRIIHRLLEELLRRDIPLPAERGAASAVVERFMAGRRAALAPELRGADPRLLDLAWERAREVLTEFVVAEARAAAPLAPGTRRARLFEWPFRFTIADHRELEPEERVDVIVTGALDRADVVLDRENRVVAAEVLDYKNTKRTEAYAPRIDPERAMGTTAFQIPVYALALRAAPDLVWTPYATLTGGYLLLRAEEKRLTTLLAPALLEIDPQARRAFGTGTPGNPFANRIVELAAAAASGRYDVDPHPCDPYCHYRHACRYQPPPEENE